MAELLERSSPTSRRASASSRRHCASLDRAPIRSASHILISVAGAIGAVRLQNCARGAQRASPIPTPAERSRRDARRCIAEIDAAVAFAREPRAAAE